MKEMEGNGNSVAQRFFSLAIILINILIAGESTVQRYTFAMVIRSSKYTQPLRRLSAPSAVR